MNLFFLAVGFCWDLGLVGTRELRDVEHGGRGEKQDGLPTGMQERHCEVCHF